MCVKGMYSGNSPVSWLPKATALQFSSGLGKNNRYGKGLQNWNFALNGFRAPVGSGKHKETAATLVCCLKMREPLKGWSLLVSQKRISFQRNEAPTLPGSGLSRPARRQPPASPSPAPPGEPPTPFCRKPADSHPNTPCPPHLCNLSRFLGQVAGQQVQQKALASPVPTENDLPKTTCLLSRGGNKGGLPTNKSGHLVEKNGIRKLLPEFQGKPGKTTIKISQSGSRAHHRDDGHKAGAAVFEVRAWTKTPIPYETKSPFPSKSL